MTSIFFASCELEPDSGVEPELEGEPDEEELELPLPKKDIWRRKDC